MSSNPQIRVLFIEDSEDDALLAIREISHGGFSVDYQRVETADQMQTALENSEWDVVICDHHMPRFNSFSALRLLKTLRPDIPFISVSGTLGEDMAVEAMRAGAYDYMIKSNLKRLVPSISRALRENENRKAHRAAEDQLRLLEAAIRGIHEGVVVTDARLDPPGPTIVFVNDYLCRLTGYAPGELIGKTPRLFQGPKTDRQLLDSLKRALRSGQPFTGETVNYRKDRSEYLAEWHISPVRDRDGSISNFISTQRDLTERRRAEQRHAEMERQFRVAQKLEAVGQLAGGIAHDFNNLLVVINGYAQMLRNNLAGQARQQEDAGLILQAGERAADLTRRLLTFSRQDTRNPRRTTLNDIIKGFEKMLRRLVREDIDLQFHLASDIRHIKVDPGQMEQILLNLSINASDAMPHGGILAIESRNGELSASNLNPLFDAKPGHYSVLTVRDNGTGISEDILSRIYEPFFTTKGDGKGTGLGLATVLGIVKAHGGLIRVHSREGAGTEFQIYLPEDTAAQEQSTRPIQPVTGGSETILLVEDQPEVRTVAARILAGVGYQMIEAGNGEEALEAAARHSGPVHLLLSDVIMPRMSGPALADRLLQQKPDTRVLFVSGHISDVTGKHVLLNESSELLRKPYQPDDLARAVRNTLDRKKP